MELFPSQCCLIGSHQAGSCWKMFFVQIVRNPPIWMWIRNNQWLMVSHNNQTKTKVFFLAFNILNKNIDLPFLCVHCGSEYPMSLIEETLIERVSRMHTAYVLQDWRCIACKKVWHSKFTNLKYCINENLDWGWLPVPALRLQQPLWRNDPGRRISKKFENGRADCKKAWTGEFRTHHWTHSSLLSKLTFSFFNFFCTNNG